MLDNSVEIVLVTSQPEDYQDILQKTQDLLDFSLTFRSVVTWSQLELLDLELFNNLQNNTTKSLPLIYLVDQAICQNQTSEQLQQFSEQADPYPIILINNTPENILNFCQLNITDTFTKQELTPHSLAHCLRLTVNIIKKFQKKLATVEDQLKATIPHIQPLAQLADFSSEDHPTSAQDLEQAYSNLNTVGAIADEQGHILRANAKFCDLVGYSQVELITMTWLEITYPPDLVLQKTYNQNILSGVISSYTLRKRYVHKKGHLVWANVQVAVYHKADGQKRFMMQVLDEVQEYPEVITKLIELTQAVNPQFDYNLPDLIARFDKEFRHIYVSDVITDITGLPPETFIGKTNRDLGLIDDLVKFWDDHLTTVFNSGKPQMIEFTFDTPHLGTRNFEGHLFPEFDENYQVNTVLCITHDVTHYKSALVQLQKNQVLLDRIANNSPYIIYLYNLVENTHLYINEKITNILGYTMETVRHLGREFFLQNIHPDDQQVFLDIPRRFKKNLTNQVLEYDYRLRHANGTWRWLRSHDVVFQRDEAGNIQQILCSTTDITYHKLIENQLW
ncbi:MAG: PAS domain-containing protein, partial [Microcoleaceae cyanobacterium]